MAMTAPGNPRNWSHDLSQHDAASATTRRSRSFGGCGTCRSRRMKCDEAKPTCAMCKASQLVCSGYEKNIFFGSGTGTSQGQGQGPGPARFRRHMLTESERQSMSEAIRSSIPPAQALGHIADIDDRCEAASTCEELQITRGPFGAFRIVFSKDKDLDSHLLLDGDDDDDDDDDDLDVLDDPVLTWDGTVESVEEDISPTASLDCVPDDIDIQEETGDGALPQTSQHAGVAPLSPLSISAILNDLDLPLVESSVPISTWLPMSEFGRVQEVSDDMPWTEVSPAPALPDDLGDDEEAGLDIPMPSFCATLAVTSTSPRICFDSPPLTIPPSIHQDVPHDTVLLLKHYSTTVLTSLTPFRHGKTPWHVLFIPHVKGCLAALTLGEKLDHATLCTFYATLALSASSIAGISSSEKWHEQAKVYKQHAQWRAVHVLQTAYNVPKVAKYKSILMALLAMFQVSTMTGERDQAECYLLETEKFIRIKGLNRRKSRKVRLLHHCYAFERFIHESSWPGNSTSSAYQKRIRLEIESSGAGAFSQDSLGFELSRWSDLDKEMPRVKGQAEGENDLHLQIPGSWPATLYPEIFGVPEIIIFLLSNILRLNKAKENVGIPEGRMSIGEFMMRAKSIERMISRRQPHPYRLASTAADSSETSQSPRLLGILVQAMQEALAIHFYRSVYDVDGDLLLGNVTRVRDCLCQIDAMDPGFGAVRLLWPALVAAKEVDDPEARSFFADWFTNSARRTGASIFLDTLARVRTIWAGR